LFGVKLRAAVVDQWLLKSLVNALGLGTWVIGQAVFQIKQGCKKAFVAQLQQTQY